MQLQFEHEYLKELYYTKESTDKKHRFQPEVVAGYVKSVAQLEKATTHTPSGAEIPGQARG